MRGPLWVIDVRCYRDQACLVQLASETRGILLGALALKDVMKELSQPSFIDSLVRKVLHGRVSSIACLSYNDGLMVNEPMFGTATAAPGRDGSSDDWHPQ